MMKETLRQLQNEIWHVCEIFNALSDERASITPAKGKWCIKEILGQLIDSAFNNQRRFILMPSRENLIFDSYDQGKWVLLSGYKKRSFTEIVETWKSVNLHIIKTLLNFDRAFWEKNTLGMN